MSSLNDIYAQLGYSGLLQLVVQAFRLLRGVPSDDNSHEGSAAHAGTRDYTEPENRDLEGISVERIITKEPEYARAVISHLPETTEMNHSSQPTAKPEDLGSAVPSPVATNTKKELVSIIKAWIDSHPQQRFPEVANYDRFSFESQFAFKASLTDTGERVYILRLGIIEQYQGWVLEKSDGSHILVKSQYLRSKGGHVYYPWLGGDLGFSDQEIAHHRDVPKVRMTIRGYARAKRLDPEDLLNEYDIVLHDLEDAGATTQTATTNKDVVMNDAEDSDSNALDDPPPSPKRPKAAATAKLSNWNTARMMNFLSATLLEKKVLVLKSWRLRARITSRRVQQQQ
ncbi:MAG: hypothetical protein L6R39_005096 [Caloplaca ligustica]|nr:MAG: hypothetical protein L6R39_005096 [Caloplaca ligustica]